MGYAKNYYGPESMPDAAQIETAEKGRVDYNLTDPEAVTLMATCFAHPEDRAAILADVMKKAGPEYIINLFAQFIGLANSVAENCAVATGGFLLQFGADIHPHEIEKLNMPSIYGALNGVRLANAVGDARTCAGCAYRKGAWANQCASTTIDAETCQGNREDFMCHADMDAKGNPLHKCVGYATYIKLNPES